jgi:hypothetical protein
MKSFTFVVALAGFVTSTPVAKPQAQSAAACSDHEIIIGKISLVEGFLPS